LKDRPLETGGTVILKPTEFIKLIGDLNLFTKAIEIEERLYLLGEYIVRTYEKK